MRYIDPTKLTGYMSVKKRRLMLGDRHCVKMLLVLIKEQMGRSVFQPEIEEFFVYTPKPNYPTGAMYGAGAKKSDSIKIAKDSIVYCSSGLVDRNKGTVLSYLHKAIKSLNQLRMIEDSLVIYRLSRAPERRIFYIDVGNLPKVKAEQYLQQVMSRYRNKLAYDANTGEVHDDRKFMSMMEDFWLPRREGGRGTEITTLPGGQEPGRTF